MLFLYGSSMPAFYLSAILYGVVLSSSPVIMAAAAADYFGARVATGAFAIITVFSGAGQMLGPLAGGWLSDVTGHLYAAYWLTAVGSVAGVLAALLLQRPGIARSRRAADYIAVSRT